VGEELKAGLSRFKTVGLKSPEIYSLVKYLKAETSKEE
jgi:hypothetical protein